MEAAVVAKGREFSGDDLAWIRAQVETREDLTRSQLSREVCERLEWRRHDGSANDMTCRSALLVLNERGLIPLPQARSVPPVPQPVVPMEPLWGRIDGAVEDLGRLRIEVVTAGDKELSRRWRELMAHHELGDGQLMGRQLRYLVGCATTRGWIAALAFSMPAYALAARDQWIGWSVEARKANLDRVVCNSRFLIAPWVRVRGLASKLLGAIARRLPGDWAQRYGVEPVLLETFVDSERYSGTCYRAASWTLVGETTGLGRLGCYEEKEKPRPKHIYVRALRRNFRAVLQREPLPRNPPAPRLGDAASDWAEEEIGGANFGDSRLGRRAVEVLRDFWSKPQGSIPLVSENAAKTKAVYRFMANPNVNMAEILAPHAEATTRRVSEQEVALVAQDTTSFNYTTHYANSGIGPIGSQVDGAQGLLLHDTLALTPAGLPLGVVDAQVWARDAEEFGKNKGKKVPIEAKESVKWLKSFQAAQRVQRQCPDTMIVSVGDREADVYELFAMALSKPDNPKLLVRSSHDRTLVIESEQSEESAGCVDPVLWDYVPSQAAAGMLRVTVPRNKKRKQPRVAELTIRFAKVRLKPPEGKARYGTLPMWAVLAHEMEAPDDEDAIQWMLLTTVEVGDVHRAIEMVQWYAARWGIEVYHKTLKSGCKIEERQLSTVPRLENCLAFDMIVAWRVMYVTMLGRETPDLPCTVCFEDYEWKSLYAFVHRDLASVPESTPTLGEAVPLVGRLGGHLGRRRDMPAGVKCIWLGIGRLYDIGAAWQAFGPEAQRVSSRGRSG